MRIFYDCEFLENGRTIRPISIGLCTEDEGGPTYYAVNDELLDDLSAGATLYREVVKHPWVFEHVVPHLPLKEARNGTGPMYHAKGLGSTASNSFHLDPENPHVLPLRLIRAQVREFVLQFEDPQLWAWYGAYDHVMLAQLVGGRMIDLPRGFPMWTNDIRTLAALTGPEAQATAPEQASAAHHALNDARHDRDLYDYYAPLVDVRRLA